MQTLEYEIESEVYTGIDVVNLVLKPYTETTICRQQNQMLL